MNQRRPSVENSLAIPLGLSAPATAYGLGHVCLPTGNGPKNINRHQIFLREGTMPPTTRGAKDQKGAATKPAISTVALLQTLRSLGMY